MRVEVKRFEFATNYTVGKLYIDGDYICYVLEDAVRQVEGQPVSQWKIQDETAIPRGTYKMIMSMSNRFKKVLPELLDVPGFSGIRIHTGNSDKNTSGCLLLGTNRAGVDWISGSTAAFILFMNKIKWAIDRKEDITVTIS